MENDKYGELILNTIDQLRKRKARPDLDRICHMLQRQYGLNSAIVQTELDKLIGEDRVIKVDYKGNTSYRNAAKWSKVKRREYFKAMSAEIAELQKEQQLKQQQQQLCAKPVKRPGPGRPRKYPLPNGTEKPQEKRLPGRPPGKRKNLSADNSTVLAAKNVLENKRVKKNYESSFEEITETPDSTIQEDSCSFCGLSAAKNPKGIYESLLCCTDCKMKSHPSCMDYSPELAAKSQMGPWQCMDCKSCAVCNGSGNGDTMLFCDACDKGYHMKCHNPAVIAKPNGVWMCSQCIDYNGDINKEIEKRKLAMKERDMQLMRQNNIDSLGLPTPCDSPVPGEENCSEWNGNSNVTIERKYPNVVPDPKDWTIDDVAKFFLSIGFADQASAFKEQEIDGKSLLLLKRSDVLTGLSIKLGPALKIYNHVKRLQTGLSIEKLDL